jgi:restriction endonuclease S subunit
MSKIIDIYELRDKIGESVRNYTLSLEVHAALSNKTYYPAIKDFTDKLKEHYKNKYGLVYNQGCICAVRDIIIKVRRINIVNQYPNFLDEIEVCSGSNISELVEEDLYGIMGIFHTSETVVNIELEKYIFKVPRRL